MKPLFLFSLLLMMPLLGFASEVDLALTHKNSGTLYIKSDLGIQAPSDWLVDTGSDYSVIDQAAIDALLEQGRAHYLKDLRGKLADGSVRIVPLYLVDSVRFGQACEVNNIKVAVLPNSGRRIMGLSALRQMAPFSITFDPPTLTVSSCREPGRAALKQTADKG